MATIEINHAQAPSKFQGTITLTLSPEEAHVLYLLTRLVGGPTADTARQYTQSILTALEQVGFAKGFEHALFESPLYVNNNVSNTVLQKLGTLHEDY
jgi:hypothetical protein